MVAINTFFNGTTEDTIAVKIIRPENTDENDVFKLNFIQSYDQFCSLFQWITALSEIFADTRAVLK